jgi:DNA invertase Pin-like site-specific DNA recombinase
MRSNPSCVGVYLRVSTLDQQSGIESQEKALREYCRNHGIAKPRVYRDRVGGGSLDRPSFDRLQADIFAGKVKTIIVWKLDRLSRSLRDGVATLCDWLERGVRIVSVTQQFDFSGATGKLVASLLYGLAELEREALRENTKRGMQAARENGKQIGRPKKLRVSDIAHCLEQGDSMPSIAKKFSVTIPGVYAALRREGVTAAELRAGK